MGERAPFLRTARRGLLLRCPACGAAPLFSAYLKLQARCPQCGAEFSDSETADVAPYLTVFTIGIVVAPSSLALVMAYRLEPMQILPLMLGGALAVSLALLPRIKGLLAALLWRARRKI